jgi:hypothetical protein
VHARSRSRRSTVALAIATLLVALAALEAFSCVALRVSEGRWIGLDDLATARAQSGAGERGGELGVEKQGGRPVREGRMLHPYLGYVMDPRLSARGVARAGLDRLSVELGFPRNREPVLQPPDPGRAIIGVFGGSVADILTEAGEDALREALAEAPRFRGREIVLLSLAATGYKQPQPLMALNYLLSLGAHFDAVVELDGVNDVVLPEFELRPLGVAPFYPRGWYTRAADLAPELRLAVGRVAFLEELRRQNADLFSYAPLRWSRTAGLVWSLANRRLETSVAAAEAEVLARPKGHNPQAQGPRLDGSADDWTRVVDVWQRSSLQMARLCEGLGIAYFHFLQPNQYVPDSKPMDEAERRIAWREDSPMRAPIEQGYVRLRAAGAELAAAGVAFGDLSGVFREVREPTYVDKCCHLNDLGNRLLGAAIGRAMAEAPALSAPAGPPPARPVPRSPGR